MNNKSFLFLASLAQNIELTSGGNLICYLPPAFEKRQEVLFWGLSPSPLSLPSPWMFHLISRLLLKLAF